MQLSKSGNNDKKANKENIDNVVNYVFNIRVQDL